MISSDDRFLLNLVFPEKQNLHPIGHPIWQETQTECLLFIVGIITEEYSLKVIFIVPSFDLVIRCFMITYRLDGIKVLG